MVEGTVAYGTISVLPTLTMPVALGDSQGPAAAKSIPSHFSRAYQASQRDVELVFGREDQGHFWIGNPLDMETKVCLDLDELVKRSIGVFGKSGTGKTFLTRLLLVGILQGRKASSLIFDMHSEYGWGAKDADGGRMVKGLKQLFPSQVSTFTLDEESSLRRRSSPDEVVRIGYGEIEPEDVDYHYLRIGESDRAVEIIKKVGNSYYDQGRWSKLASWLDSLPAHVLESDSEIVLLSGQVLIRTGDLPGASEQFDKLLVGEHANDQKILARASIAKSTVYRLLGHLDLAVSAAQNGLALLEGTDCSPEYIAEAHRQLASSLATQGELDLGKHHFRAALEIAREDNLRLYSLICDGLAVALIEQGELDEAAVYLEQARLAGLTWAVRGL